MKLTILLLTIFSSNIYGAGSFFGIGDLIGGSSLSTINAVNSDGTVFVGTGVSATGWEAFTWTRSDGFRGLGSPSVTSSYGNGVSADGRYVVGHYVTDSGITPFVWSATSGMTSLPRLPGATQATARDVSADGKIVVGGSSSSSSTLGNMEPARWDSGVVSAIGDLPGGSVEGIAQAISDSGDVIVGYSISSSGLEGFRWSTSGGLKGLGGLPSNPYTLSSEALAVSSGGDLIVGYARGELGYYEATVWTDVTDIRSLGRDPLSKYSTYAKGISEDGTIVVGESNNRAFIWNTGQGMRDLKAVLEGDFGLDLEGWTLLEATGISDDGTTIVGRATLNGVSGYQGFVAVIPEPNSLILCLVSLASVCIHRNRRWLQQDAP